MEHLTFSRAPIGGRLALCAALALLFGCPARTLYPTNNPPKPAPSATQTAPATQPGPTPNNLARGLAFAPRTERQRLVDSIAARPLETQGRVLDELFAEKLRVDGAATETLAQAALRHEWPALAARWWSVPPMDAFSQAERERRWLAVARALLDSGQPAEALRLCRTRLGAALRPETEAELRRLEKRAEAQLK